jgi:hypothetical protein
MIAFLIWPITSVQRRIDDTVIRAETQGKTAIAIADSIKHISELTISSGMAD